MGENVPPELTFIFAKGQMVYLLRQVILPLDLWPRGTRVHIWKRRARKGKNPRNVYRVSPSPSHGNGLDPIFVDECDLCSEEEWAGHLLVV